jgi:hypothetical protein
MATRPTTHRKSWRRRPTTTIGDKGRKKKEKKEEKKKERKLMAPPEFWGEIGRTLFFVVRRLLFCFVLGRLS